MQNLRYLILPLGFVLAGGSRPAFAQVGGQTEIQQLRAKLADLSATQAHLTDEEAKVAGAIADVTARLNKFDSQSANAPTQAGGQLVAQAAVVQPAESQPTNRLSVPASLADHALKGGGSNIQFGASNSGGSATFTVGSSEADIKLTRNGDGTSTTSAWNITVSSPLSKTDNLTSITTLDKLSDGTKVAFGYTYFSKRVRYGFDDPDVERVIKTAVAQCQSKPGNSSADAHAKCADGANIDKVVSENSSANDYRTFESAFFPNGAAFAFGGQGSIAYADYSFLNATSTKAVDTGRVPIGARIFGSLLPDNSATAVTLSFEYQYAFKAGKAGAVCPVGKSNFVICSTGAVGKPARDDSYLTAIEFRNQFNVPWLPFIKSVAISPQLTYDANDNVGAIDFPVYLVPDSSGNLIGGLRFGYSTDKHDFVAGVFVGSNFSLLPN